MRIVRGSTAGTIATEAVPHVMCKDEPDGSISADIFCGDYRVHLSRNELLRGLEAIRGREERTMRINIKEAS